MGLELRRPISPGLDRSRTNGLLYVNGGSLYYISMAEFRVPAIQFFFATIKNVKICIFAFLEKSIFDKVFVLGTP